MSSKELSVYIEDASFPVAIYKRIGIKHVWKAEAIAGNDQLEGKA